MCLISLVTSYQFAHPEVGKLIYCTRTVPEMMKCIEELKRVIGFRAKEIGPEGERVRAASGRGARGSPSRCGTIGDVSGSLFSVSGCLLVLRDSSRLRAVPRGAPVGGEINRRASCAP